MEIPTDRAILAKGQWHGEISGRQADGDGWHVVRWEYGQWYITGTDTYGAWLTDIEDWRELPA